ncbi:cytidine deaminase [Thalassotalea insulae]|uniref:Cytidine deaminase n=1 Tax=Thalassotalea insulae TaxID=2056778 RepID=A0ABQ6GW29_9GAMM|nr:cytidine deaminase [Thalassotalea insulae]GLX80133.1 cytidine deaminase [Thalassotalea insulae]
MNITAHESALIVRAKTAYQNAYAPYSNFHVGAAALTKNGNIVSGCNVENASYGLTVCAERNCIAQAVINGEQQFETLVIYTEQEKLTPPCGACRQVIVEFFQPQATIMAVNHLADKKTWTVEELLPNAFTPKDLI